MDTDAVDVLETGLISRLCILLCVLLSNIDHLDIPSKLELDQILGINLEIVGTLEAMYHLHLAIYSFHTPLSL